MCLRRRCEGRGRRRGGVAGMEAANVSVCWLVTAGARIDVRVVGEMEERAGADEADKKNQRRPA